MALSTRSAPGRTLAGTVAKGSARRRSLVMLLPAALVALALGLYPVVNGIYLGFTNYRVGGTFGITPLRFVGFGNFAEILADNQFVRGLLLIGGVALTVVAVTYLLAYLQALLLSRPFPLRRVVRTIVLLPMAAPPLIAGQVWRYLYDPSTGAVNRILLALNLESDPEYLPLSNLGVLWIAIPGVWLALPLATLLLLASIQGVPDDLNEAAEIDGAGAFRRFVHVTFPATRGVLAAIIPLSFAGQLLAFDVYFALSGGAAAGGSSSGFLLPSIYAYLDMSRGFIGRAAAASNLILVLVLLAFWLSRRISLREER